jgi:hypothetical protein
MKLVHEQVVMLPLDAVWPSPENAKLYRPVTPDDDATIEMAESVKANGILDPLVISADNYIISGHRRHCAARIAGLKKVPCRKRAGVRRGDGETASDEFLKLLREHNRQRVKTRDELLREAVVSVDPKKAHRALTAYRKRKAKIKVEAMELRETAARCEISAAKMPMLQAIERVIEELRDFWPLSLRQIHYQLLNDPPLIHASKADSRYSNSPSSYKALIDLATRARHDGWIDYETIDDATRPVTEWAVRRNLSSYYGQQIQDILNDYWRDLMQSQPNHVELVAEKNTLQGILRPVAMKFCLPFTIGRGQCSTRPLYNIAKRYEASGKEKLVILAVSDCDPDGESIAHSLGQRLRDDHHIEQVAVFKCALTLEQVRKLNLPEKFERAKRRSPNYSRYVEAHGTELVWELEAVRPDILQDLVTRAIEGVIDRRAFNREVAQERADAAHLATVREIVLRTLREEIETS